MSDPWGKFSDEDAVALAEGKAVIEDAEASQKAAAKLLDHYGAPNEATPDEAVLVPDRLVARMEVTANEVLHEFPMPHVAFFTQYVWSRGVQRPDGQPRRRDHGSRRTVDEAPTSTPRRRPPTSWDAEAPYAEKLLFEPPQGETADPDEVIVGHALAEQVEEDMKDLVGQGRPAVIGSLGVNGRRGSRAPHPADAIAERTSAGSSPPGARSSSRRRTSRSSARPF